ncbi:MAG TPA: glycosyltransferase family 2 protein [Candidatus Saccharimonadales bacterium]|nr:glycosyltransferase family 2 protein [Candidatus Saccharimonadales bacterium]
MNRVAVVVVNYKGIEDTKHCLAALSEQTFKDFTIIAIENGSHDRSVDEFKKFEQQYGDNLITLYNDKNLGFDGGVNTGIHWAMERDFEYIILCNNDALPDENWVKSLVAAADKKPAHGIITSLLLLEDGTTIDSTGDWYSKWGLPFPRNRHDKTEKAPKAEDVFGGTGGASLFRMKMLREIGIFDEDFFAYYEDIDISFRAQLYGWKVYYEPKAIAYHQQGATANRMPGHFAVYQTFKNLPLVYIKNVPRGLLFSIGIRFWFAYALMLGNAIVKGRGWDAIKGWLMSIVLFWTSALPKRLKIQKDKKVSAAYIRSILWADLPPDQTGLRKLRRLFIRKSHETT